MIQNCDVNDGEEFNVCFNFIPFTLFFFKIPKTQFKITIIGKMIAFYESGAI